jgi:hypothetical protein
VLDFKTNIYGFRATKKMMRELEPELLKTMNGEIRRRLDPVRDRAKQLTPTSPPLSGWGRRPFAPGSRPSYSPYGKRWDYNRLEWHTTEARKNIVVRQRASRTRGSVNRTLWQIQSNNPSNAVFELMGRGKSNVKMVQNVMRKHPGTGRVLYRAWDQLGGDKIEDGVVGIIRRYEKEFNRRLDAAGGP